MNFRKLNNMGGTAKFYRDIGTPGVVSMTSEAGALPSYYWSKGGVPHWAEICGTTMRERYQPRSKACAKCFMACGKVMTITEEGPFAGTKVEGPEYETIYTFGGLNAVDNLPGIAYLNELCDRLGLDTISAGNVTALAIEASRRGKVDFKLEYGDVMGIAELLREIASRTGRGELFSLGTRAVSKELGMEDVAVHVKGLEPAGYDPRALKGMGLAYAISDRGACHLRATVYKPEMGGKADPQATEGKAELVLDFEDRHTLFDTLVFCRFYRDTIGWDELPVIIRGLTGLELDKAGMQQISANIANLIRTYNLREGMSPEEDTLPPYILNNPLQDSGKTITKSEIDKMVGDYYALRGW
jgi:aldehyde:ferredoxin oxidoreductase